MKTIAVVCAVLVASISALPEQNTEITLKQQRLVTDTIASIIEDVSQTIRDAGLDPLHIENESVSYELPVPVIFSASANVQDLRSNGLSNIVINNLNFGLITTRLTFDIALPRIDASLGSAGAEATIFGSKYEASASGRLAVVNPRITGNVRVSVGIISGISIRDINLNFSLGGIESNLNVNLLGVNVSNQLNTFLGTTIPATLLEFRAEINELLEIIVLQIANEFL